MKNFWKKAAENFAKKFPRERLEKSAREKISEFKNRSEPAENLRKRVPADSKKTPKIVPEKIAIACSGGSDSLALLLLVPEVLLKNFPRERVVVFHLNHNLRGEESAGDADFVEEISKSLGFEFVSETLDWRNFRAKKNVSEELLRERRLAFFAEKMRLLNAKILLQGHQKSDVEELLLMRISRGAGTAGLSAPRPISRQKSGEIFIRPLLEISKIEIENLLRALEIPWREDSSNAGTKFFRNRIRHEILPKFAEVSPFLNISRSRKLLEEADEFLEISAENFLKRGEKISAGTPKALARRVYLKNLTAAGATISAKNFAAHLEKVAAGTKFKFSSDKNSEVFWNGNELKISKKTSAGTRKISKKNSAKKHSRER